uniref:RIMS binding protein 2 n=1 Tax=Sinocyclocheilus rhinocerous TaxID=307959 RepID=A0A673GNR4_9TELE
MREAAERRQQLELEHEQALAVLSAKQQEIDLLQKVRDQGFQPHQILWSSCTGQSVEDLASCLSFWYLFKQGFC